MIPVKLFSKIQEFMDWLTAETDVGQWHPTVIEEIHRKLITIMISDKVKG